MIIKMTVPLAEATDSDHVMHHVALTEAGYDFLVSAVCQAGLGDPTEHDNAEDILRNFLCKNEEFISRWNGELSGNS